MELTVYYHSCLLALVVHVHDNHISIIHQPSLNIIVIDIHIQLIDTALILLNSYIC